MTQSLHSGYLRIANLLRLASVPAQRELLSVTTVMNEARDLVREDAREKSINIVVIGVEDEVLVHRTGVVLVLAALLQDAVAHVQWRGRVAITGQPMERDLVFGVYNSGWPLPSARPFAEGVENMARLLQGRLWTSRASDANLALFSVPLHGEDN